MKNPIQSFFLDRSNEDAKNQLQTFAQSFGHKIETWQYPIIVFHRDNKWISYAQIVQIPVVFPAFHTDPDICSKFDTLSVAQQLIGWANIQYGAMLGACPMEDTKVTQQLLESLGGKKMNKELYEF